MTLAMDKSADLRDLDLTCASRGVWLVKVGNFSVVPVAGLQNSVGGGCILT